MVTRRGTQEGGGVGGCLPDHQTFASLCSHTSPTPHQVSMVILPCTTRPRTPSTCLGVSASMWSWRLRPPSSTPCTVLTAPGACWPLLRGQRSGREV